MVKRLLRNPSTKEAQMKRLDKRFVPSNFRRDCGRESETVDTVIKASTLNIRFTVRTIKKGDKGQSMQLALELSPDLRRASSFKEKTKLLHHQ